MVREWAYVGFTPPLVASEVAREGCDKLVSKVLWELKSKALSESEVSCI